MVEPSALADTATPPIFSPAPDVIVPVRSASACAVPGTKLVAVIAAAIAIRLAPVKLRALVMAFSLHGRGRVLTARSLVSWRQSHKVGGDGGDLTCVVGILEGGHARRSIGDHLADRLFPPARAVLGELGAIKAADQGRSGMAHAARLLVEAPAQLLLLVERMLVVLRQRALRPAGQQQEGDPGATLHLCHLSIRRRPLEQADISLSLFVVLSRRQWIRRRAWG